MNNDTHRKFLKLDSTDSHINKPKTEEDKIRALYRLFEGLSKAMNDRGYEIIVESDGTAYVACKEGPFANPIIAMEIILKREKILDI